MKRALKTALFVSLLPYSVLAATIDEQLRTRGFALVSKHYTTRGKDLEYTDTDVVEKLETAACRGEFEPVTLTVVAGKNLSGVRLEVSSLSSANGASIPSSALEVRMQKAQTTGSGQAEVARQLLYPAMKPVEIKGGTNVRFWITVLVPREAKPGNYKGTVSVKGNGVDASIPLELRVYGFGYGLLPARDAVMVGTPDELVYYRDCAEHGMTCICSGAGSVIKEDQNGFVEMPALEKNLQMAKEVGLGEKYIAYGGAITRTSKVKNSTHILEHHPYIHPMRQMKAARAYREIVKEKDLPEVIWYIFDEPGKGDTRQLGPLRNRICHGVYQQVSEIPGVRTFLTMGHEETEEFGEAIDIHCYGGAPKPEDVKKSRECGALVWRYSNGISMGTNPLYSRFAMGFFPWRCDWDGSTSWTYPIENGQIGEDGKPIPPAVWEAIREGVDDWYYLLTLEDLIRRIPNDPTSAEARQFLDSLKQQMDPNREACPWQDGREMDEVRAKIAEHIEKLAKLAPQKEAE